MAALAILLVDVLIKYKLMIIYFNWNGSRWLEPANWNWNRPDSLIKLYNNFETKSNISQYANKTTPLSDISIKLR